MTPTRVGIDVITASFSPGNEQYNTFYPEQVAAMEAKAVEVGVGGELYYINPANGDWFTLNTTEGGAAEKLKMADHLIEDFHVAAGGAVEGSVKLFANNTGWHEGSCNLETNAGIHTMARALTEAQDLNLFFAQFIPSTSNDTTSRIKARTASFCTERSGYNEGGANDQGIAFYLPNMTWIQPPGYVHAMIHDSWLPKAVKANVSGPAAATISASAQIAEDGSQLR